MAFKRYTRRPAYKRKTPMRYRRKVSRKRMAGRGKSLRQFKRRMLSQVGISKRDRNKSKVHLLSESNANYRQTWPLRTHALFAVDCTDIAQSTGAFERTRRMYAQVDLRGVKYNWLVRNKISEPLMFNYALVSFKNGTYPLTNAAYPSEPYECPTLAADGFFRSDTISRDENFDIGLSSVNINYDPISTDQYNVHMHKRVLLGPNSTSSSYSVNRESYKRVTGYVPIKRVLRYNDDSSNDCENRIYLVYWVQPFMRDSGAISNPQFQVCDVMMLHKSYFRDVLA